MIYAKKIPTNDKMFENRAITIVTQSDSGFDMTKIPVPDDCKMCDSCNRNVIDEEYGYLIYTSKSNLDNGMPWGFQCTKCAAELKPKYIE